MFDVRRDGTGVRGWWPVVRGVYNKIK